MLPAQLGAKFILNFQSRSIASGATHTHQHTQQFTLSKVKAHQTEKHVVALHDEELAAFSAHNAAESATWQGATMCSAEMEREKVMSEAHATIRKVLQYFGHFLPQVAEHHGRGWKDAESMIGSREQDETTAALFESRWSKWPRYQLRYRYEGEVGLHSVAGGRHPRRAQAA